MGPVRLQWVERVDEIEDLEPHWRALEARVSDRMAFASYDFLIPWYRHNSGPQGTPLVGTAWRGDDLVALVPLAKRQATLSGVPLTRVDGAVHEGDIGELLVPDDEIPAFEALLESLVARGGMDAVVLKGLVAGSPRAVAFERVASRRRLKLALEPYHYAVVDLSNGYVPYERSLGSKLRGNLRRRAKRAGELGGIALDRIHFEVAPDVLDLYLKRMFSIASRSWKEVDGAPEERYQRYFAETAHRLNPRGMLDLAILTVGSRDAAFILAARERGTYFDIMISFDQEFGAISPGSLLIQEVLRRLPDEGISHVVSHGDYEYKRYWASEMVPVVRAVLFAPTLRGRLAHAARYRVPSLLSTFRKQPAAELPAAR